MNKYLGQILLLLCCSLAFSQQQKPQKIQHIHSDKIQVDPAYFGGNQFFSGKVQFEHNGAKMYADTVVFYEKRNYLEAISNVKMIMPQGVLTSQKANYNGNTQIAQAQGNVILKDKEQTLYTDKLEYNRKTNKAYYNTGGTIESKDNTISSRVGIYDVNTKTNTFDNDVSITNKDYVITGKNVKHHADEDYMEFFDDTFIQNRKNNTQYITSDKGRYYFKKKEAFLEVRSTVHSDGRTITGDRLYYNQLSGYGKGTGDVIIEDPAEKRYIKGDYGEVFREKDSAFVTQNAMAVRAFEKDSLYLHADTLMATQHQEKGMIRAYHKAKFFKSNIQGKADSIAFEEATGQMKFFRDPIVWSGYRQITGDTIVVYSNLEQERLDSIHVRQRAFAIAKKDSLTETDFHQLKSRYMLGIFVNEQLDWIQAEGNAQSLSFMDDENEKTGKKELVGINLSDCGIVEADFEQREMHVISCRINADSEFYPPSKLTGQQRYLPDFKWREEERLHRWQDIFVDDNDAIYIAPEDNSSRSLSAPGGSKGKLEKPAKSPSGAEPKLVAPKRQ